MCAAAVVKTGIDLKGKRKTMLECNTRITIVVDMAR